MSSLAGKWVLVEKENYGRYLQKSGKFSEEKKVERFLIKDYFYELKGAKTADRIFDNIGKTRLRIQTDLDSWTYAYKTNVVKNKHTYKHNQENRDGRF